MTKYRLDDLRLTKEMIKCPKCHDVFYMPFYNESSKCYRCGSKIKNCGTFIEVTHTNWMVIISLLFSFWVFWVLISVESSWLGFAILGTYALTMTALSLREKAGWRLSQ